MLERYEELKARNIPNIDVIPARVAEAASPACPHQCRMSIPTLPAPGLRLRPSAAAGAWETCGRFHTDAGGLRRHGGPLSVKDAWAR